MRVRIETELTFSAAQLHCVKQSSSHMFSELKKIKSMFFESKTTVASC